MKHILRLSLLSLFSHLSPFSPLTAQWLSSPAPAGGNLEHVFFANDQVGYTTSANGYIYKTTNGGQTWTEKYHPGQLQGFEAFVFNNIYFTSPQTGYFVGLDFWSADYLILRTTDGGDTWSSYTNEFGLNLGECNVLDFPTASTGYVGGDFGRVFKTTNAGGSWQVLSTPGGANDQIRDVDFVDAQTGFMVDQTQKLFKTTNGGSSWQTILLPDYFQSIQFFTAQIGIAGGYTGVYKTTNGGVTWSLVGQNVQPSTLTNLFMLDENTGYAFLNGLRKTIDGGEHWYLQEVNLGLPPNTNAGINALFCANAQTGWMCGFREVNGSLVSMMAKTSNGGGIGIEFSITDTQLDCPAGSAKVVPDVVGNPATINWYLDNAQVASGLGAQTIDNIPSGLHDIRMEASAGTNVVTMNKQLFVEYEPDFSGFSSFSISQQPCAGDPATVNTNWNNPYQSRLMIFQNNQFIDTAEVLLNPFGNGTFQLPAVSTPTTFQLVAAYKCGDVPVNQITVFPRPLPNTTYALSSLETVFCEAQPSRTFKQADSDAGAYYRVFQNGQEIGAYTGNGGAMTYYTNPFAKDAAFSVLANINGCQLYLDDTLVLRVEYTDARFGVNGVNLPVGTPVEVAFQGTPAVSYVWSFGQQAAPATSTELQPGPIQYNGEVATQMQLITTGPLGCSDTFTRNIALYIPQDIGEYWAQEMDASNQFSYDGNSVAVDAEGNVLLSGNVQKRSLIPSRAGTGLMAEKGFGVFKFNKYGVLQWKLQHEDQMLRNPEITVDNAGNVIGLYTPDALQRSDFMYFGSSDERRRNVLRYWSSVVVKWDPDGKLLWIAEAKICNESGFTGVSLTTDADNNIYFLSDAFNPHYCNFITEFLSADSSSFTMSMHHDFIAKLSPDGIFQSVLPSEDAAGNATIYPKSFALDADKNYLVGGEAGILLAKYDPNGNLIWTFSPEPLAPNSYITLWHMTLDEQGNTYINGQFQGTLKVGSFVITVPFSGSDSDHCILKVSPQGEVLWVKTAASDGVFIANDIAVQAGKVYAGAVFTTNYKSGTLSLETPHPNVLASVWLQLSAETGAIQTYTTQLTPDPSGNYAQYGNYGNSIVLDAAGNLHLCGSIGHQVDWADTLLTTPYYLYLAKIQGFSGIVGAEELNAAESFSAQLSPNPSQGPTSLRLEMPETQRLTGRLVDAHGEARLLFQDRLFSAGTTQLPLETMPAGVYFLQLTNERGESKGVKWVAHR